MARKPWSITKEEINVIINRWANGEFQNAIAKAHNMSCNHVSKIICKARAEGDFRAVHHFDRAGVLIGRRPYQSLVPSRPVSSTIGIANGRDDKRAPVRA